MASSAGSQEGARRTGPALEATYRFTVWFVSTVKKFPRRLKFPPRGLRDRRRASTVTRVEVEQRVGAWVAHGCPHGRLAGRWPQQRRGPGGWRNGRGNHMTDEGRVEVMKWFASLTASVVSAVLVAWLTTTWTLRNQTEESRAVFEGIASVGQKTRNSLILQGVTPISSGEERPDVVFWGVKFSIRAPFGGIFATLMP